MMNKQFYNPLLTALSLVELFSLTSCDTNNAEKTKQHPNVLFIAIDDLNTCPDLCKGELSVRTPNLDKLARQGVLFNNAHCAAPASNPSRASVMTGIAPYHSGVYLNWQDWRDCKRFKNWTTLPQHFKDNGYETYGGGKLYHACTLEPFMYEGFLDARPWDEYFPSKHQQLPYEITPENQPAHGNPKFYNGFYDWEEMDISTDDMADAKTVAWACKQLKRKHDKPLFLGVGIYRPHIPWYTPKKYYDRLPLDSVKLPEIVENDLDDVPKAGQAMCNRAWHKWFLETNNWKNGVRAYEASVCFMDDMLGRLFKTLKESPMAKNTIVVLWSDHGYHLGQKEHWEKFALWEQTTRVPFVIVTPDGMTDVKGGVCQQPVSLLDIYPTLCDLCGIPSTQKLDGLSLRALLNHPETQT
ncbi:MAG: sulfatase, partial [Massilibacteroides sp.]|nr:sulfatase [Massilibacteroides sp.]